MRKRAIVVGLLAFVAGGVGVGVVMYPTVVRREVIAEARARGVELAPAQIDVAWNLVTLHDTTFSMLGGGIRGTAKTTQIALDFFTPTRISAEGVAVQVSGSPPELLGREEEARKTVKPIGLLPISVKDLRVEWKDLHLTLEGATIEGDAQRATLRAPTMALGSAKIGSLSASISAAAGKSVIAIGDDDPERAPVRLDVDTSTSELLLRGTLRGLPVDPLRKIMVDATTSGKAVGTGYVGTLEAKVRGVALPVPREVQSLVSGDLVVVKGDVSVTHEAAAGGAHVDRLALTKTTVTVGTLALLGDLTGAWTAGERATAQGTLHGQIPCSAVAGSAARANLGDLLGGIAGAIAKSAVSGSVSVTATIDVDTSRHDPFRVTPTIKSGCGIDLP